MLLIIAVVNIKYTTMVLITFAMILYHISYRSFDNDYFSVLLISCCISELLYIVIYLISRLPLLYVIIFLLYYLLYVALQI